MVKEKLYDYELKHLGILRSVSSECTLMLANNGDFPLSKPGKIALYGSGARRTIKGGTGSGEVNSRFFVTVEEGLKDNGFTVVTDSWLNSYDKIYEEAYKKFISDIRKEARRQHTLAIFVGMGKVCPEPEYELPITKECGTAIYVLSRISGEGNDRSFEKGDFLLTNTEVRDITLLNEIYDRFMLVINCGGPVDLSPVKDVKNILVLSQLGVLTGKVLADIILGKLYPSGKLTTTWARPEDYCDIGNFGDRDNTSYKEGVYVGYRYFDTVGKKPLYPFGYGLGFTTFKLGEASVSLEGQTVSVKVPVINTGTYSGKEVVQVYVSVPDGKLDQPFKSLAAFEKTEELKPGESQEVNIYFNLSSISSYDSDIESYVLESGKYAVMVGNSSVETKVSAVINVPESVIVKKVKNCVGDCGFVDWIPENKAEILISDEMNELVLDTSSIKTEIVEYDKPLEIEPAVDSMTDEELMIMNIGRFNPKGGILSVIGDASQSVAGAAGETPGTSDDIPVLVMADGPAGLRIAQHFSVDDKGVHAEGGMLPDSFKDLMPGIVTKLMSIKSRKKPKGEVRDQYCTAIPIGTALAQSFNPEIAELCGDIVGSEMERFGINLWLAPALNIHRSVLCGRNFEYFSEDPLVSGKFAAAITRGVQKHPSCGTTIKHYCANNQEYNRYFTNSNVSERAMREIYLRGFEICIAESQPHALMSSYNMLNGTHTSESRMLIEDILRSEFGFEGIVMTDWVITGMRAEKGSVYPQEKVAETAASGNDLFMPGSAGDFKRLKDGFAKGVVSREQLKINASRVYRMAKKLRE